MAGVCEKGGYVLQIVNRFWSCVRNASFLAFASAVGEKRNSRIDYETDEIKVTIHLQIMVSRQVPDR